MPTYLPYPTLHLRESVTGTFFLFGLRDVHGCSEPLKKGMHVGFHTVKRKVFTFCNYCTPNNHHSVVFLLAGLQRGSVKNVK
jgi:hypothetical protein